MKAPGFAAEASLYKTSTAYRGVYGSFSKEWNSAIIPQDCLSDCELQQTLCMIATTPLGWPWCSSQHRRCVRNCASSSPPPDTPAPEPETQLRIPGRLLEILRYCAEPLYSYDRDPSCNRVGHPFSQCVSMCLDEDPGKTEWLCGVECDSECPRRLRRAGCLRWEWRAMRQFQWTQ